MPKTLFSIYVARDIEGVKGISNEMRVAKTSETSVKKSRRKKPWTKTVRRIVMKNKAHENTGTLRMYDLSPQC